MRAGYTAPVDFPDFPRYRRVLAGPNRIYWYCVAGLLVWALARAVGVDPDGPPIRLGPFLMVMGIEALNLAGRNFLQRRRARGEDRFYRRSGWLFVAVDFLLIVAGIRLTGALESPLWVVAFVVVSGETVLEGMRVAVITRVSACVALFFGTVPLPPQKVDFPAYALEMFVRMGLVLAVSSVVRRLREGSDGAQAELANLRGDLALVQERSRLSRDIHDGVGNSLAGAVLRLEMAARVREKTLGTSDETVEMLKEEAGALREAMGAVRDWTFHNRPWSTDGVLASVALQSEADRVARRTGLSVTVEDAALLDGLSEPARLAALRIVQESLTNAAKHAGASSVFVRLTKSHGRVTVEVRDDGAGFDPGASGSGIGLASMRERAAGQSGGLAVRSEPGAGTTVTLTLPARP